MSVWAEAESVNEVGEHARLAEDSGFEHVTLVDEPFLARDVFTALAMVALNTERVQIGHGVVDPLTYFPTALGNAAATLHELSGGRAFLGLGAGGPAGKFMEPLPFKKFEESVIFLKKFMSGEEAEYKGHKIHSEWIKDPVPLYLAADGPRSLKLAGRLGDGVITMGGSPTLMKWKLKFVEEGLRRRAETRQRSMSGCAASSSSLIPRKRRFAKDPPSSQEATRSGTTSSSARPVTAKR